MTGQTTVAELFELAIKLEESAQDLYRGFESKFSHHQKIADFWKQYAAEEAGHARWLARLRGGLSTEELSALADPSMYEAARRLLKSFVGNRLAGVTDLEDAYQLAHELENSEINTIFEFLIVHFSTDETTQNFLRSHLKDHIGKLMLWFPTQFNVAVQDD